MLEVESHDSERLRIRKPVFPTTIQYADDLSYPLTKLLLFFPYPIMRVRKKI